MMGKLALTIAMVAAITAGVALSVDRAIAIGPGQRLGQEQAERVRVVAEHHGLLSPVLGDTAGLGLGVCPHP